MITHSEQILPKEDRDCATFIEKSLIKDGVNLIKNISVENIFEKYGKTILNCNILNEKKIELDCDCLLFASGRVPNIEDLDLTKAGVNSNKYGIIVNNYLQTSNSNIFAVGDCASRYQFTHMAEAMARIVVKNALFFKSEKEFDENDRAIVDGENEGFVKLVVKEKSDEILGATIVGPHAGDLISEITLAMNGKIGLGVIAKTINPYPTYAETIRRASEKINTEKLTVNTKKMLRTFLGWKH